MKLRRATSSLLAALPLVFTGWLAPAHSAEPDKLVVFGDSVAADPPIGEYLVGSSIDRAGLNPTGMRSCPRSDSSYGLQAARLLGLEARDYSCSGTSSISKNPSVPQFTQQVDAAMTEGSLSPSTRRVVIMVGFNDTYSQSKLPADVATANYVNAMVPQIERIRQAAPNARIQLVGYPAVTMNGELCIGHLVAGSSAPVSAGVVKQLEDQAESMNALLSREAGVEFLDLRARTAGNGLCARDNERFWSGLFDFTGEPYHLPFHLNARGHAAVASMIAES